MIKVVLEDSKYVKNSIHKMPILNDVCNKLLEDINSRVMTMSDAKLYSTAKTVGSKISCISSNGFHAAGVVGGSDAYTKMHEDGELKLTVSELLDYLDADWDRFEIEFGGKK